MKGVKLEFGAVVDAHEKRGCQQRKKANNTWTTTKSHECQKGKCPAKNKGSKLTSAQILWNFLYPKKEEERKGSIVKNRKVLMMLSCE
jgi:hypothetical protein